MAGSIVTIFILVLVLSFLIWAVVVVVDAGRGQRTSFGRQLAASKAKTAEAKAVQSGRRRAATAAVKTRALAAKAATECPHCGTKGEFKTYRVKVKGGISGGKATGAILTGGVSLLATGLSRTSHTTVNRCNLCRNSF